MKPLREILRDIVDRVIASEEPTLEKALTGNVVELKHVKFIPLAYAAVDNVGQIIAYYDDKVKFDIAVKLMKDGHIQKEVKETEQGFEVRYRLLLLKETNE